MISLTYVGCNGCSMVSETLNYPLNLPLVGLAKAADLGAFTQPFRLTHLLALCPSIPGLKLSHCFACTAVMHLNSGLNRSYSMG